MPHKSLGCTSDVRTVLSWQHDHKHVQPGSDACNVGDMQWSAVDSPSQLLQMRHYISCDAKHQVKMQYNKA
jgi:hypothetical protein